MLDKQFQPFGEEKKCDGKRKTYQNCSATGVSTISEMASLLQTFQSVKLVKDNLT